MHRYFIMIFLIAHTISYSQDSVLQAELDYALIPASNQRVSAQQVEAALKVPLDFGTVQLQPTIGLRNYDFEFWESMTFNTHPVDNVNNFFAGVDATHSLGEQWQLDAWGEASWASGINANETVLTGAAALQYTLKSFPAHLRLGVQYDTPLGDRELLPLVELAVSTHQFYLQLGFPESRISYALSESSTLSTHFDFEGDYFYVPQTVDFAGQTANQVGIARQKLAFDYAYNIDAMWSFSLSAGYLFQNELKFYDSDQHAVNTLNMGAVPVFSTGIKFNFSKQ